MFGHLFGWRKASKCKKLVKSVKYRLKLLKNKKCCIVNQMRNDVARLLGYGLDHIAFQRVEQLIADETTLAVYDLVDRFCQVIIINLPYIRKHKDCPKDINEAASTLIFSSARIGELPELISIRKLFEERYGQTFVMSALDLLPGNIVNFQMIDKIYAKKVPDDDEKYQLLHEIAASGIHSGQHLLAYKPELLVDNRATEGSCIQIPTNNNRMSNRDSNERNEFSSEEASTLGLEEFVCIDDDRINVRSSRKTRRNGRRKQRKRLRRRRSSTSKKSRIVTDPESAAYYGESEDTFLDNASKFDFSHKKKISVLQTTRSPPQKIRINLKHRYRTMSTRVLAAKRVNEDSTGNAWRSMSFPLEKPRRCEYSYWHGAIHPKLPNYDELATKFVVLKTENLQKKNRVKKPQNFSYEF